MKSYFKRFRSWRANHKRLAIRRERRRLNRETEVIW